MQSFGEKLKSLRVDVRKLTLMEAANQLGVPKSNLYNWERGIATPSMETLCKLAVFYRCSTDYLIGFEWQTENAETVALFENLPKKYQKHIAAIIRDYYHLSNKK